MERRNFLLLIGGTVLGGAALTSALSNGNYSQMASIKDDAMKLTPPKTGAIPVAFLISSHATVIDFAGPWEVFQDVAVNGRFGAFELFTVAESPDPITATAGLKIVPNHTFASAPQPKVVVIGAQSGRSPAMYDWLKKVSQNADVIMSVCTGAFLLARSGLIDGKQATTHHGFYDEFAREFPKIELKRGLRFVEEKKILKRRRSHIRDRSRSPSGRAVFRSRHGRADRRLYGVPKQRLDGLTCFRLRPCKSFVSG